MTAALLCCAPSAHPAAPGGHGHSHAATQGVVALDVYHTSGRLHLLTAATHAGAAGTELWHQSSEDGGVTWSQSVLVNEGLPPPQGPSRGNDPQIAASGDKLVAVWMTRGTGLFDSGPMATALSSDGGKTWRAGVNPADDGTTGGHGFIDVAADPAGGFHLAWLDSRDGAQGLRYAVSHDAGATWQANKTLDARTCECCWNTMAMGSGGLYVLYRDTEPRDMRIAKVASEVATTRVGDFGWNFTGCPHVGGGLAITNKDGEETIHAAVWTGQEGSAGLHYVQSGEKGVSKQIPIGDESAWHPDIAADAEGNLALAWDRKTDTGSTEIWASVSKDRGSTWSTPRQISAPKMSASHPRVVAVPSGFRGFWTETPEGQQNCKWQSTPISLN